MNAAIVTNPAALPSILTLLVWAWAFWRWTPGSHGDTIETVFDTLALLFYCFVATSATSLIWLCYAAFVVGRSFS